MTAGPVGGAVGPPDALRAARLFLQESVGCVPGLPTYQGRGGTLGSLPGPGGPARGSVRVRGRGLGSLPVCGGLARWSARARGRGLALAEARDQLRSFVASPLKVTTSSQLQVRLEV